MENPRISSQMDDRVNLLPILARYDVLLIPEAWT